MGCKARGMCTFVVAPPNFSMNKKYILMFIPIHKKNKKNHEKIKKMWDYIWRPGGGFVYLPCIND